MLATYTDLPRVPVVEAEKKASELLEVLETFTITDPEDVEVLGTLLKEVHTELKELDKLRLVATKPAREAQRDINAFFAGAKNSLSAAKSKIKKLLDDHRRKVAEQNAKAMETLSQGQPAAVVPVPVMKTRQELQVEIIDAEKVPREYLCIDLPALKALAKAGGEAPPGVRFVRVERTVVG